MNTLSIYATFFGWCSVINIGILLVSTLCLILFDEGIKSLHGQWFKLNTDKLDMLYFKYLAAYKVGILLFNLTPYIALNLMIAG